MFLELDEKKFRVTEVGLYYLYVLIIGLCFAPVVISTYAFSDDYTTLFNVLSSNENAFQWDMMSGRPVYAVVRYWAQSVLHGIGDFSWLRLAAVVSIAAYCCFVRFFIMRRALALSPTLQLLLPLALSLIPAMTVYASWATCFPFALAMLLSGVSYYLVSDARVQGRLWRVPVGCLLLIAAFGIYQPAAMTFALFMFLDNCITTRALSLGKLVINVLTLLIGMVASFLMAKVLPLLIYHRVMDRGALTDDFPAKLLWFWREPLRNVANNYNIDPVTWYTNLSTAIIVIALLSLLRLRQGGLKILLALVIAVGSYSPNLILTESWAAFRSLVAIESIGCALFVLGLWQLVGRLPPMARVTLTGVLFAGLLALTQSNLYSGFIDPQRAEYRNLTQALSDQVPKDYDGQVMFDLSDTAWNAFAAIGRYDEYGNISLSTPWAPQGMAESIRQEKHFAFHLKGNVILTPDNPCPERCIVIKSSDIMRKASPRY